MKRRSIKQITATDQQSPDPALPGSPFWRFVWDKYRGIPLALPLDRAMVRWTNRSVIIWLWTKLCGAQPLPALMLETIGRASGALRIQVLPYYVVGDELVVLGTLGGGPKDPMWVENLRSCSSCWRKVRNQRIPMLGRVADADEREVLRASLPDYWERTLPRYEARSAGFDREIPFVVLTPRARRADAKLGHTGHRSAQPVVSY